MDGVELESVFDGSFKSAAAAAADIEQETRTISDFEEQRAPPRSQLPVGLMRHEESVSLDPLATSMTQDGSDGAVTAGELPGQTAASETSASASHPHPLRDTHTLTLLDSAGSATPSHSGHGKSPAAPASDAGGHSHFTTHEFGPSAGMTIEFLNPILEDLPEFKQSLFLNARLRRPRQFFIDQILYREREARKVTWEELFVDLVYVAVVSQCGKVISDHHPISWLAVNDFALAFIAMYMCWSQFALFMNRFLAQDLLYRVFIYIQLILAAGLALNAEFAFSPNDDTNTSNIFFITYLISRSLYGVAYLYNGFVSREFLPFLSLWNVPLMAGLMPIVASFFIPSSVPDYLTIRRALYWSSFLVDTSIMISFFSIKSYNVVSKLRFRVAVNIEHLVERMGLLVIVILGEVVVNLVWSSRSPNFSFQYLDTILGLIVALTWQWHYFVLLDGHGGRFIHPIRNKSHLGIMWNYTHLGFTMALVLGGSGMGFMTRYDPSAIDPAVPQTTLDESYGFDGVRWLVCGGFGVAMICSIGFALLYQSLDTVNCAAVNPKAILPMYRTFDSKSSFDDDQNSTVGSESSNGQPRKRRPICLRYRPDEAIRLGIPLDPRFPKWKRVCVRVVYVVAIFILGALGGSLGTTAVLSVVATLGVLATLAEEFGRLRVPRRQVFV